MTTQKDEQDSSERPSEKTRRIRLTRDGLIFAVGLLGIVHQTLLVESDRPTLLLLFGAMIGLPAFLRLDEKKSSNNEK